MPLQYKIMIGPNKGKITDLESAKIDVISYIEDIYYAPHNLSFNAKGDFKDFTLDLVLLRQVRQRNYESKPTIFKVNEDYIKRLKEKVAENREESYFTYVRGKRYN